MSATVGSERADTLIPAVKKLAEPKLEAIIQLEINERCPGFGSLREKY